MNRPKIFASHAKEAFFTWGDNNQYSGMVKCPWCGRDVKETNVFLIDIGCVTECDYECEAHGYVGWYEYGHAYVAPNFFEQYIFYPIRNVWFHFQDWWRTKFRKTQEEYSADDDLPF